MQPIIVAAANRFVKGNVNAAHDVPDLAQMINTKIVTTLERYDPKNGDFTTWVNAIARSEYRNWLRAVNRQRVAQNAKTYGGSLNGRLDGKELQNGDAAGNILLDPTAADPAELALQLERRGLLTEIMAAARATHPKGYAAFQLIDIEGLSSKEAAAQLGIGYAGVRDARNRFIEKMREEAQGRGLTNSNDGMAL